MHSTEYERGQSSNPLRHSEPQIPGVYSKHYGAFQKDKTKIPVNSFVLVSSNEHFPHIGYITDLKEDKTGSMKAIVRWLCRYLELKDKFPVLDPNSEEIYLTNRNQTIDVESIDSIATVLTPDHYSRCSERINDSFKPLCYFGIFMCCKEIAGSRIKPFDISQLRGYSNQSIHSPPMNQHMDIHNHEEHPNQNTGFRNHEEHPDQNTGFCNHEEPMNQCTDIHNPEERMNQSMDFPNLSMPTPKKARSHRLKKQKIVDSGDSGPISVAEQIPISDDSCSVEDENMMSLKMRLESLIRSFGNEFDWPGPIKLLPPENECVEILHPRFQGRWYRCQILVESLRLIKVEYHDKNARQLEDVLPAPDVAPPSRLDIKLAGRMTVRPLPLQPQGSSNHSFQLGDSVDVLWNDKSCWCEVVISPGDISTPHKLLVYLPGENLLNLFDLKELRVSKDWINNEWREIPRKMDILSVISAMLATCADAGAGANPG